MHYLMTQTGWLSQDCHEPSALVSGGCGCAFAKVMLFEVIALTCVAFLHSLCIFRVCLCLSQRTRSIIEFVFDAFWCECRLAMIPCLHMPPDSTCHWPSPASPCDSCSWFLFLIFFSLAKPPYRAPMTLWVIWRICWRVRELKTTNFVCWIDVFVVQECDHHVHSSRNLSLPRYSRLYYVCVCVCVRLCVCVCVCARQ